ncbi:signal peptide peptidase SppA [Mesosutterella sp. OilRF-GAM-744-9]|uniref:Signal peptide peptidase SppA n=1 Tax=Mesosutterella porci TaxID=2915351 RepID=A0ABS9MNL3_9BURK|nr:signal peptide peptidase SppA [Mesosutterella sp. oilRF-744-WT-GAM-9]MCG5030205.1 signal peptide peptidase SppA [Mesosutterella sp. oilRF-744-WT-GAM-9]MCI6530012.1 signal peptide peptidase SppA [Mesosutterella sp.]
MLRLLKALYRGIDTARRAAANLLFLLVLLAIAAVVWLAFSTPGIPSGTILEIPLNGSLVMSSSTLSTGRSVVSKVMGQSVEETTISDVTEALDLAARDPRIRAVVLRLDGLASAGPASVQEIGDALQRFRKTGRKVYAWADTYSQARWAIASNADETYMSPMGEVKLRGLESSGLYWGRLIDRLGITVSVVKAGAYKSAPEVYTRSGPSPEAVEAQRSWMGDEWEQLTGLMESARGMPAGAVHRWISGYLELLRQHNGDAAQAAADARMITALSSWSDLRSRLAGKSCVKDGCENAFTGFDQYLLAASGSVASDSKIGVVTLEGEITEGPVGTGKASSQSLVPLIQAAQADSSLKALIIQINSPGGSAVAAEQIREALKGFRSTGRPVVAYFGDMAASGGYWVSTAADKVVSSPLSITGSIGVFGIMPSFEKVLDRLGVGVSGMKTEEKGGEASLIARPGPDELQAAQLQVDNTYAKFLARVAKARGMTTAAVDKVGQGRVWTGRQAKQRGLVDELGNFGAAVAEASKLAGIKGDAELKYLQPAATQSIADMMLSGAQGSAAPSWLKGVLEFLHAGSSSIDAAARGRTVEVRAQTLWEPRL